MRDALELDALEPDIVSLVLQKVMTLAPGFSQTLASQIEQEIKASHGGHRHFVPKGLKRTTPRQRQAIYADGLTDLTDKAIADKHGVSRSTLYRVMKDGGGRFSGTP